jgi:hypothetical protein
VTDASSVSLILIDTNIWVDHFQRANRHVLALLDAERVAMHPYIVAELALGGLRDRDLALASLELLPELPVAELHEVRQLIEIQKLYTFGVGLVDAHLIASLIIVQTPTQLWTNDQALKRVARNLGFLANPSR